MGFLDFIFENIFLIFIIISGIIGFLGGNKDEQKKKQQQRPARTRPTQRQPRPTPTRASTEPRNRGSREVFRPRTESKEPNVITATESFEAEQKAQMERVQERFGASGVSAPKANYSAEIAGQDLTVSGALQPIKVFSEEQEVLKKDVSNSLRGKGLINGIIMAEVLGKPRSLKPFESPTLERYKK